MQLSRERIIYLLEAWTAESATEAEVAELQAWVASAPDDLLVQEHIQKLVTAYEPGKIPLPYVNWEQLCQQILDNREQVIVRPFSYRKWIAVAAVFIAVIAATYFLVFQKSPEENMAKLTVPDDVSPPDKTKATITLADGRVVYLDSAGSGQLAQQGGVQLVKMPDGQIAYHLSAAQAGTATGEIIKELQYNTLSNPRGSIVIDMQLADGSRVWLNAGSSITYPVAFTEAERRVTISGEAYFEVAPDKFKPFYVSKNTMEVQVLGTHFNVNAYDDEPDIKVTLLEGRVKVRSNSGLDPESSGKQNNPVLLKPGQQAAIHHSSLIINNSVDIEQVMAWKNGKFSFNRANIQTVMRELSRWYNIEIEYRGNITKDLFGGDIQRNLSLNRVLDFLKQSQVHFEVSGSKVIVMP